MALLVCKNQKTVTGRETVRHNQINSRNASISEMEFKTTVYTRLSCTTRFNLKHLAKNKFVDNQLITLLSSNNNQ
ncbi:hypothetical protein SAMN05192529_113112 [Arachidicoccus rhizosphaerae]|uniref:Uncharacterized protein n=2 Tax=Arachidicoccus rhizosphaerae TaxID=551991 RepID=A0A1H4A825_9BACT|nr:hypothetical protein SAMN05192529_113112 [Arachidicoccus rhizosphaerae]